MRHGALPRDHVRNAVTIHISKRCRMGFSECHPARILGEEVIHNHVSYKGDRPILIASLLPPRQAVPVAFHRPDNIRKSVAVHIVDSEFGSSGAALRGAPTAESLRVVNPSSGWAGTRLLPPAVSVSEVH